MGKRGFLLALIVALGVCLVAAAAAQASTVLSQGWESGLGTWTTSGEFWHVQSHPESVSVKSPDINPNLVTLPDSGQLPSAFSGTNAAWFGEASTGTFCGSDFATVSQSPKGGCTSSAAHAGQLVSPAFSLTGATSAIVHFHAWWEIESVDANTFDVMTVEYSTDGGTTWTSAGKLNPINNPAGSHDQSYSNNGLEQSPSWKEYLVDLSPAAGQANVKVRFNFNTGDTLYNGFRGLLIDDVAVNTPYDVGSPSISSVTTCQGATSASIWSVHGANFVENSKVFLDSAQVTGASVPGSDLVEVPAGAGGNHTVQVQSPNGAVSNSFAFTSGNCASAGARPTATQASCNYIVATGTDTCTATVGDAGAPPRTTPTGQVKFTSNSGGVFTAGDTCNLTQTPLSPGVASCSVEWLPPNHDFPKITATYLGDSTHSSSSGSTSFLIPGNVTGLNDNGPQGGSCSTCPTSTCSPGGGKDVATIAKSTIPEKLCYLVQTGGTAAAAALLCKAAVGTGVAGQEEFAVPLGIGCAVALAAAGYSVSWLADPPDAHYRELALPPNLPNVGGTKGKCHLSNKQLCKKLKAAGLAYLQALRAFAIAQGALAITGNRLTTARAAKDLEAILLQISARKLYVGVVSQALAAVNQSGATLRKLLGAAHLNVHFSHKQLVKSVHHIEKHPSGALLAALKNVGMSRKTFNQQLQQALKRGTHGHGATLAAVVGKQYHYGPLLVDYQSIKLENLRALVRGLAQSNVLSSRDADALGADLACYQGHSAPSISAFLADAGKLLKQPYASLISFAAQPLSSIKACS